MQCFYSVKTLTMVQSCNEVAHVYIVGQVAGSEGGKENELSADSASHVRATSSVATSCNRLQAVCAA